MRWAWIGRLSFGLVALLSPASLLNAALPTHRLEPASGGLAGQLLSAAPGMKDPRFQRTVILMVRHGNDGAFAVTINRPMGERSLASLLENSGEKDVAIEGSARIFAGGPVQPEIGF